MFNNTFLCLSHYLPNTHRRCGGPVFLHQLPDFDWHAGSDHIHSKFVKPPSEPVQCWFAHTFKKTVCMSKKTVKLQTNSSLNVCCRLEWAQRNWWKKKAVAALSLWDFVTAFTLTLRSFLFLLMKTWLVQNYQSYSCHACDRWFITLGELLYVINLMES